jgi:hypothetical protein
VTITAYLYEIAAGIEQSGREVYHRILSRVEVKVKVYLLHPMCLDYIVFNYILEIFAKKTYTLLLNSKLVIE